MWTQAEHIREWWGPDGFSVGAVESDPRPGGALTIVMVGPDFEQTMQARYTEVDEGRRIVVESVVHTQEGEPFIDSSHTVTFRDLGDRTEVTVAARASVFDPAGLGALAGMRAGWGQSLQRLDDAVRGTLDRQIVLTRLFEAPPARVFQVWMDVSYRERWWGPERTDFANLIVFDEIVPDERLVFTHSNSTDPRDPPFTSVVTFEEMDEMTVLSLRHVFDSAAARDLAEVEYRAVEGASQTLERLSGLLGSVEDSKIYDENSAGDRSGIRNGSGDRPSARRAG